MDRFTSNLKSISVKDFFAWRSVFSLLDST